MLVSNLSEFFVINFKANEEVLLVPFIRACAGSIVSNTVISGNAKLSEHSTVCNSSIQKYFSIGLYSFMQRCRVGRYVSIGSRCSVGAFSHPTSWLSCSEFQYRDTSYFYGESLSEAFRFPVEGGFHKTVIGHDVWIGDNVVVKAGIVIGHGSVIGAASVVTKDVEPYSVLVGNPARLLRKRFTDQHVEQLLNLCWWDYDISALAGVRFNDINLAISDIEKLRSTQGHVA